MADTTSSRSWRQTFSVYGERSTLTMYGLGFACGLPFWLIYDTLTAWLRGAGLSLDTIAFFSLATLPYAFKFLWAPLMDRTHVPVLTRLMGHRRSWMIVAQVFVVIGLVAISLTDPSVSFAVTASVAVFIGFAGATQDIVVDAWRIEVVPASKQGAMLTTYQWGHRTAFLIAGAVPLYIADAVNWGTGYFAMAGAMGLAILATVLAPQEPEHQPKPIPLAPGTPRPVAQRIEWIIRLAILAVGAVILGSGLSTRDTALVALMPAGLAEPFHAVWIMPTIGGLTHIAAVIIGFALIILCAWPLPGRATQPGLYLAHSFGDPLKDFFSRYGRAAAMMIVLICFYRVSQFVMVVMLNPFYLDLGFTNTDIANVRKLYGVIMDMTGVLLGGVAITRFGLMRCLVVGAAIAPLSNLGYAFLATQGPSIPAFMIALGINNICQQFAGVCLIAYMSSLTSAGFTATQYALFTSLYALPDRFIMTQSGRVVESIAHSAADGGFFAPLTVYLTGMLPGSFAAGAQRLGVSPEAAGAGYFGFFFYTCLMGLAVVPVAMVVYRRAARAGTA
jgi:PAT family beta-lactamase induction signal transducer AmpG